MLNNDQNIRFFLFGFIHTDFIYLFFSMRAIKRNSDFKKNSNELSRDREEIKMSNRTDLAGSKS